MSLPVSDAVLRPQPMPTEIGMIGDFEPIIEYLKANIEPSHETIEFKRGCVHSDGRLDLCEQGVGHHMPALTRALIKNDFIHHLLIGNDVVGKVGVDAIADCLLTKQLRTLYLAGGAHHMPQ